MEPQTPAETPYPLQLAVDYPDRELNRMSTAFRIFAAIPILIVAGLLTTAGWHWTLAIGGAGILFLPTLLMIVFRQKYPRWWYDWNLELLRFVNRVYIYLALMDDRYPSTDEKQSLTLEFAYPDVQRDLNRWLPLVKWLLAIPHYIVLVFLWIATFFVVVFAWFAILFTGRYPRGMFEFVEGVLRWDNRVAAYAFLLVTDRYPPFRLNP
jgi:Domain of unknown function (DUF4389)